MIQTINGKKALGWVFLLLLAGVVLFLGVKGSCSEPDKTSDISVDPGIGIQTKSSGSDSISFFAEYRMERERTRSKQIELLREIMSQNSQGKAREAASLRLANISEDMEKEMKAENLVKSAGYTECIVIIQPAQTTVVLKANSLSPEQEDKVKKIVATSVAQEKEKIDIIIRK
jgi:stage III sporulation protein AH